MNEEPEIEIQQVVDIKNKYQKDLLSRPGVVWVGAGRMGTGVYVIVYVKSGNFVGKELLPRELDGIPVSIRVLSNPQG